MYVMLREAKEKKSATEPIREQSPEGTAVSVDSKTPSAELVTSQAGSPSAVENEGLISVFLTAMPLIKNLDPQTPFQPD